MCSPRLNTQPNTSSTAVIAAEPTAHLSRMFLLFIIYEMCPRTVKHMLPASAMLQCDHPRNIISING